MIYSPLRYPGGKGQIYKYMIKLLSDNNLEGCTYIEPFAGGAGLAMRLLFEGKVESVIINDFDRSIYAVWYSILYKTDEFISMIQSVDITVEEWKIQKKIQENKEDVDLLTLGFSTFFLNRTNRSGIIKGGIIGGINQNGKYKIDCRFNKESLIELIIKISGLEDKIELYNLDAIEFIDTVKSNRNQFYFIDPPYYKKGQSLYTNFFTHEDHLNLSRFIKKNLRSKKVLISYDDCDEIKKMYRVYNQEVKELNYFVETKRKGKEIFISNNIV